MSLLKTLFVIMTVVSISKASIEPHYDFSPHHGPTYLPSPVLPPPVFPGPAFHVQPTAPLLPTPVLPAPAPLCPAPAPTSYFPAPVHAIPAALPLPVPLARPLPPIFNAIPFAPSIRAIPGPVKKTHHVSVGLAYPVQVQLAKLVAPPVAHHVHPLKIVSDSSHAHFHSHSAPLISPHHHHHHGFA